MTGTETLGRSFEYEIYALSKEHDLSFDDLLGHHGTLKIELPDGGERFLDARMAQFGLVGMSGTTYWRYRIVARPWTWILTRTRDFLMRLIAQHGLRGAARVLRALADELEGLAMDCVYDVRADLKQ